VLRTVSSITNPILGEDEVIMPFRHIVRDTTIGKKTAFTLIELLVVIAIITILMAILFPTLRAAREQARKSVCLSNQRQIMVAANVYLSDNDGKVMYQHAGVGWAQTNALTNNITHNWIKSVWSYVETMKIFNCESNKFRYDGSQQFYPTEEERISYVANGILTHFGGLNVQPSRIIAISDDYATSNGAILRPHFAGDEPNIKEEGWVGWMRYAAGAILTGWPHKGRIHGYLDGHAVWNAEMDITSRKYGLLIDGEDTYEPDLPGYTNPGRWGKVIPALVR
jgi:prepilin-type N-terminal cleavage/methylation domain-containing protein